MWGITIFNPAGPLNLRLRPILILLSLTERSSTKIKNRNFTAGGGTTFTIIYNQFSWIYFYTTFIWHYPVRVNLCCKFWATFIDVEDHRSEGLRSNTRDIQVGTKTCSLSPPVLIRDGLLFLCTYEPKISTLYWGEKNRFHFGGPFQWTESFPITLTLPIDFAWKSHVMTLKSIKLHISISAFNNAIKENYFYVEIWNKYKPMALIIRSSIT